MIRGILLCVLLGGSFSKLSGQCVVQQQKDGQVYTICDVYASRDQLAGHSQITYSGSQFFTFPIFQPGKIWLDTKGQEMRCEVAYNMFSNEVLCRLPGDSTIRTLTPERVTINDIDFFRPQSNHLAYFATLYMGQTGLLKNLSKKLIPSYSTNDGYDKNLTVQGTYQTITRYYIQKGNAEPELLNLTKKSLLSVLYEQSETISARLTSNKLTEKDVIETLKSYDSLMVNVRAKRHPLSNDALFDQVLHDKITYPGSAWNQGVYGRVCAGFEVNEQGTLKDVVILSPDNGGFGFVEDVKQGLEKMPRLHSSLAGKYALPVTFTYTNTNENVGTHSPVNRLSEDRLANRTLLEEFVIPIIVSKPVVNSKEVWGYFN